MVFIASTCHFCVSNTKLCGKLTSDDLAVQKYVKDIDSHYFIQKNTVIFVD